MTTINLLSSTTSGFLEADFNQIKTLVNGKDDGYLSAIPASAVASITLNALSSNSTFSGILASYSAGETVTFGTLCYMKSDGKMWKADADQVTTMPGIAIATATVTTSAPGVFLLNGNMRYDTWNWTVGGIVYASTTAGNITQTAPSGSGDQVQSIGVALTADSIVFNPNYVLVQV
jgi:hypothetical protein